MLTDQEIYDAVMLQAKTAKELREEIDEIWNIGLVPAETINTLYIRRNTELPNCFTGFLDVLCSAVVWNATGLGQWAAKNGVNGPLNLSAEGDSIDKLLHVLESSPENVKAILGLHLTPKDRLWMTDDINFIKSTVDASKQGLARVKNHLK
jgi:hypothetical protein